MIFFQGLAVGGSLIIAIGAQNAFVLSHGIRQNYVLTIAFICSLCDALLIVTGVSGVGLAVADRPPFEQAARWGGIVFLTCYGIRALISAYRGGGALNEVIFEQKSYTSIILATLGVTLLNPHVYLDTMLLLGGIGSHFLGYDRVLFATGAITASFIWFFTLSFGGKKLAPFFQTTLSWRILDGFVGIIMLSIATSLFIRYP